MRPWSVLRIAPFLALGIVCGGCAKFPANGGTADYTRLSFRFRLRGAINPNYVYIVAMRVLDPPVANDPTVPLVNQDPRLAQEDYGPVQVGVGYQSGSSYSGSANGFVEGLPTQYAIFSPGVSDNWRIQRFFTAYEQKPTNDDSPINTQNEGTFIGYPLPGSGVPQVLNTTDPTQNGSELGFDIDTSYLARGFYNPVTGKAFDPQAIRTIQFNILTMNRRAIGGNPNSGRYYDALGDQRSLNTQIGFRRIQINTSGTYTNATTQSNPEPGIDDSSDVQGAAQDPSVDIVDWSLSVRLGSAPGVTAQ